MPMSDIDDLSPERIAKLRAFAKAFDDLEGVPIEYGLLKHHFPAIQEWLTDIITIIEKIDDIESGLDDTKSDFATVERVEDIEESIVQLKKDIRAAFAGFGKVANEMDDAMKKDG